MTKRNLIVMQKWQIVKMVANQTVYILRGKPSSDPNPCKKQ